MTEEQARGLLRRIGIALWFAGVILGIGANFCLPQYTVGALITAIALQLVGASITIAMAFK